MKVLHVIPSMAAVHGGPSRAIVLMETALRERGIDVETATTDDDGPGKRNGRACGRPLREGDATRWYFRKAMEFYKPSPAFARWAAREVGRFDVVHIHGLFSFTSTAAARAARRAGVPYVVRPLGALNLYGTTRRRPWLKRLSIAWIEAPLLARAAAVHFTSEQEAAQARRLGIAMNEAVIPLAVEGLQERAAQPHRPARDSGGLRLLFLSRLDPKKNVEQLLEAVARLRAQQPGIGLQVAGDGSPAYVATLKARAESLGLAGTVTWSGHVEGAAKAAAFADADLFVLPSLSENFGIAAAEALAAGVPCLLGEDVAIAQEVAQAGAGAVTAPDAASIAGAITRLAADPAARTAMSARAQALARERYSMAAMGERLAQLYASIARR